MTSPPIKNVFGQARFPYNCIIWSQIRIRYMHDECLVYHMTMRFSETGSQLFRTNLLKQLCLYACKLLTFKKTSPWRIPIVRVAVIWLQPHIPFPNIRGRESVPHYNDVIMGAIASQITSLTIVLSTVYADAEQRKHQSSASLVFVRGIHRRPVDSPHKWPVTRKCFHLMTSSWLQPATRRDRWLPPTKGKFYALWLTTHFPYHWPFMGWLHL